MNYYERIIRNGMIAADEYTKKENNPIEELHVTEQELEELDLDVLMVLEDLVDPSDPIK
jgi:hypothetical protein